MKMMDSTWIELLAEWISRDGAPRTNEEMNQLYQDLQVAVAEADSLVSCSSRLQATVDNLVVQYEKTEANV